MIYFVFELHVELWTPARAQVLSPSIGADHAVHADSCSAVDHTTPSWALRIHKVKPLEEGLRGRQPEDEKEKGSCPIQGLLNHSTKAECPPSCKVTRSVENHPGLF